MRNKNVAIIGSGSYLPKDIITNEDLCKNIKCKPQWIKSNLGISERRFVDNETNVDLAYNASVEALKNSNVSKEDLDLIIAVTSSPDQMSPTTASILHNKLDINKNVPSIEMNGVCSGFIYAMSFSSTLIASGQYKNILIVASETYSKHISKENRNCIFFGDGAGAVVLGQSKNGWMVSDLSSNGKGTGMSGFRMPLVGDFDMIGREVWDKAITVLPESIRSVLKKANMTSGDIDIFVPHQPSLNILKIVAEDVGISIDKVKVIMHKYANIASASIPIALDDAFKKGEIKEGDKILLSAIGSGWSWGSMVINHEK